MREEIKALATRKGTNVTQLTLDYYRHLLELEHLQEAEQI
jgi:hypothetical protein